MHLKERNSHFISGSTEFRGLIQQHVIQSPLISLRQRHLFLCLCLDKSSKDKWLHQGWRVGGLIVCPSLFKAHRPSNCLTLFTGERDFCLHSLHTTYFHIKMTNFVISVSFCWCSGTGQHTVSCKKATDYPDPDKQRCWSRVCTCALQQHTVVMEAETGYRTSANSFFFQFTLLLGFAYKNRVTKRDFQHSDNPIKSIKPHPIPSRSVWTSYK